MKYTKKSREVEALQWDGTLECAIKIKRWSEDLFVANHGTRGALPAIHVTHRQGVTSVHVKTKSGILKVEKDDWVIMDLPGHFYPCKNEEFKIYYFEVCTDI